jgi:hypothetical protein
VKPSFVSGLAVLGPGLPGWAASEAVLLGREPWREAPCAPLPPALLPATERRRASPATRLALAVAAEAVAASGLPPEDLETVFASSNGDGSVIGAILDALAEPEGFISPTQFHNSVHNAAAGYWGIAVGSTRPSVSVGGHDHVVAAALLHAAARVASTGEPVLLVCYDAPLPPPLSDARRTDCAFAAGLVLTPTRRAASRAALTLDYLAEPAPAPAPAETGLDALAEANPAARILPLLRAVAARREATILLPMLEDAHVALRVAPC